ncbi:Oidioi.mRNA.OKI2018_I69.chr1.g2562.t1.cds [Oikopleura dioica]|uniref:Oidioi.mRNA.OKI2018_I69.chr1.g2562.t1.cds n=1 Tax=Oikopleura dioica TaxID=34765 RepID=A0ABN7SYD5_OIKDI|nr:Oidioi.mRNA.OKI2018_I69.chr1.g2562.t1.cds [Oikopleura dioica]
MIFWLLSISLLSILSRASDGSILYFEIHHPEDIAYSYRGRFARDFGGIFERFMSHVPLIPASPIEACPDAPPTNVAQLKGNMMLIKRGGCSFLEKAIVAQNTGVIGAIIFNDDPIDVDSNIDMVDDGSEKSHLVDIPIVWLQGKNGHMILNSIYKHGMAASLSLPHNHTYTIPANKTPWDLW